MDTFKRTNKSMMELKTVYVRCQKVLFIIYLFIWPPGTYLGNQKLLIVSLVETHLFGETFTKFQRFYHTTKNSRFWLFGILCLRITDTKFVCFLTVYIAKPNLRERKRKLNL